MKTSKQMFCSIPLFLDRWSLWISIKSNWSNMFFKAIVFLLVYCLNDLSTDVSGLLKSPPSIVLLPIFPYLYVNICFIYLKK